MSIQNALNTAIYGTLSTNSALTGILAAGTPIYFKLAPDNATKPYVVFDYAVELDENFTANRTKNCLAFVRGFAASPALAGSIDSKIDAVLNGGTLNVSGYGNFWTRREDAFQDVEIDSAGIKTWMSGAQYRIRLDKS